MVSIIEIRVFFIVWRQSIVEGSGSAHWEVEVVCSSRHLHLGAEEPPLFTSKGRRFHSLSAKDLSPYLSQNLVKITSPFVYRPDPCVAVSIVVEEGSGPTRTCLVFCPPPPSSPPPPTPLVFPPVPWWNAKLRSPGGCKWTQGPYPTSDPSSEIDYVEVSRLIGTKWPGRRRRRPVQSDRRRRQAATDAVNLSNLALVSYLNVDFGFIARTNLLNLKQRISQVC